MKYTVPKIPIFILLTVFILVSCQSSTGLLGPGDETREAGELIKSANIDLRAIKVLFNKHANKREELKTAIAADDADAVRKLSDEVVDIINEGQGHGTSALEKIDKAREMNVNEDYAEYLRLKWEALNSQREAFEQHRQAARKLRDNFDPKNARKKDEVKADFDSRSENFQRLMEKARDFSSQANELAKEVHFRSRTEAGAQ